MSVQSSDIDLPFSLAEYADRLAKVRARMTAAGLDALVVTDPSNMAWLTGYDGWSFYVHQAVIVGPAGQPIFWGRAMDAVGCGRTAYLDGDNVVPYPDHHVMSTERHPMDHLGRLLADRGWATGRIGVEMENYYYSAKAHAVLGAAVPGELVDATALVNWCRAVKSAAELGFMQRAARIVERMHQVAREMIAPGLRKCDLVAEITATGYRGAEHEGIAFGGDYPAFVPLLPTGLDATAAHLTWNDAPFQTGAGTFFEIAGCYRRYHAPLCRTVYLGTPPADMLRAEEALMEGIEDGIAAARPGYTAGDVARAFYAVLAKRGIAREGRCGYPIGLSYPPDWGERTYSIRPEDDTELQPDMTFHFMPGLWTDAWGLEITETLHVTKHGARCLADVPRALVVKG
ncbi:MAG: M24 family metallopeptidase [Pseudomonadota bacterium]